MPRTPPLPLLRLRFAEAAAEYLRSLRMQHPEHFMESVAQAQQRKITVVSMDLVRRRDASVHCYSELLVQWLGKEDEVRRVVPDNMLVVAAEQPRVEGHWDVPLQGARPFLVAEYVSKGNPRKDYQRSFDKYEKELKVRYYLMFHPDEQELTLFRHTGRRYVSVKPDARERYEIPEIRAEVALHEGWARFWHEGRLLPLPAELQAEVDLLTRQLADERKRADDATRRADDATQRAETLQEQLAAALAELDRLRGPRG